MVIEESGMTFGNYPEEDVFHIEKSQQYQRKLMSNGVKCCEFVLLRGRTIYFIEAKTSKPKEITANSETEKREKYKSYITEIITKMKHSVSLYASILLERHDQVDIPEKHREQKLSDKEIKLVLVVKNAEVEWLIPLQDTLRSELRVFCSIWKIRNMFVINEMSARKKHLVV